MKKGSSTLRPASRGAFYGADGAGTAETTTPPSGRCLRDDAGRSAPAGNLDLVAPLVDDHFRTSGRQGLDDGRADAGTGSGDQGALGSVGSARRMTAATIGGRRVQPGRIGLTAHHGVVDFENGVLGAIAAMRGFILAFDDGEGVHDVGHVVAVNAVEMEKSGVEFATQQKAPGFIPAEGRAIESAVLRERFQVPGGVSQFENTGQYPVAEGFAMARPRAGLGVGGGGKDRELFNNEIT